MTKKITISLVLLALFFLAGCNQSGKTPVAETINSKINTSTKTFTPDSIVPAANTNDVKNLSDSIAGFVPTGYNVLSTASGDLNLDQYPDMIIVLKKEGEGTTSNISDQPEKRPLLILIGQADNSLKISARNDNVVYCINCGGMMGDPFMNIMIKDGSFSIEHYGGSGLRWTRTTTFKFSSADSYWYLYQDGGDSFQANETEKMKTTTKTVNDFGKIPFDKFDIYKEY